ncbi:DNA cytosine methyltransferase [Leucobacter sp. BZR 635]
MSNVTPISAAKPHVLEFFAGIGLARMGLEDAGFHVSWANDYEPSKKAMYDVQFAGAGDHTLRLGDIGELSSADVPAGAALAWASSPCTDLSLAGARAGLEGGQSGTFWEFIRILEEMGDQRPSVAVLENVVGLATSNGGDDLTAAVRAFNSLGYSVDLLAIDARRFVPQSRPRLFLVGALAPPAEPALQVASPLRPDWLQWVFDDESLITHQAELPEAPEPLREGFGSTVEEMPASDERWWDAERTSAFLASLSETQLDRVTRLLAEPDTTYRTAYRRTRKGRAVWEVRPDDIAGCLRTARGGSSKQAVVQIGAGKLRVRWMTPLEYARLMGAGDYELGDARPSQVLFGFGDAVAVPAVSWLASNYLLPLTRGEMSTAAAALTGVQPGAQPGAQIGAQAAAAASVRG